MNIFEGIRGSSPSYFCTWGVQNGTVSQQMKENPEKALLFQGDQGAKMGRDIIDEKSVFSERGWALRFYPEIRSELYFCLDDGWDLDYGVHPDKQKYEFGSLELSLQRFPSFGGHPRERLYKINERLRELGWKGVALWVAAQAAGDMRNGSLIDDIALETYWRERAKWSAYAGIPYWKVDWGYRDKDAGFREMLTRIAKEEAPGLLVEHVRPMYPVNGKIDGAAPGYVGRFADNKEVYCEVMAIMAASDVLRSYDVLEELENAATLDRIAELLQNGSVNKDAQGLINCENMTYVGTGLGCTLGILGFPSEDDGERELDHYIRAVKWHSVASPFGIHEADVNVSEEIAVDSHYFKSGDSWYAAVNNTLVKQGAPVAISRGMKLPEIRVEGEKPYTLASRYPNGNVAVSTLPRRDAMKGLYMPLADIAIHVGTIESFVGVFGEYASLRLTYDCELSGVRIMARDLAGEQALDITSSAAITENTITIPGEIIAKVGLMAASLMDVSKPGMIIRLLL